MAVARTPRRGGRPAGRVPLRLPRPGVHGAGRPSVRPGSSRRHHRRADGALVVDQPADGADRARHRRQGPARCPCPPCRPPARSPRWTARGCGSARSSPRRPAGRSSSSRTPWSSWASCCTPRTSSPARSASTARAAIWPCPVRHRSGRDPLGAGAAARLGVALGARRRGRGGRGGRRPHPYGCERPGDVGGAVARRARHPLPGRYLPGACRVMPGAEPGCPAEPERPPSRPSRRPAHSRCRWRCPARDRTTAGATPRRARTIYVRFSAPRTQPGERRFRGTRRRLRGTRRRAT